MHKYHKRLTKSKELTESQHWKHTYTSNQIRTGHIYQSLSKQKQSLDIKTFPYYQNYLDSSLWWNFYHWLHWKSSCWQLPVHPMAKISWLHLQMELFPRYWPFVQGIHRSPVNSPHKGQWHGALMFSLICAWINSWVHNREAGGLRCHRANYDVIGMW